MYAVIVTGGKQYKVEEGGTLFVEKLDAEAETSVTFDKVLAVSACEDDVRFGALYVVVARVTAKVVKQGKGVNNRLINPKAQPGYPHIPGHREPAHKLEIQKVIV